MVSGHFNRLIHRKKMKPLVSDGALVNPLQSLCIQLDLRSILIQLTLPMFMKERRSKLCLILSHRKNMANCWEPLPYYQKTLLMRMFLEKRTAFTGLKLK